MPFSILTNQTKDCICLKFSIKTQLVELIYQKNILKNSLNFLVNLKFLIDLF